MSETFTAVVQALNDNPDLRTQVMSATSAADRAAILQAAGVPLPTHADVNAAHAAQFGVSMDDVAGGAGANGGGIAPTSMCVAAQTAATAASTG